MDIALNFINLSHSGNQVDVLIFQRNVAANMGETALAWKVIRRCGFGCNHPFEYPREYMVSVRDAHGNYTPRKAVLPGLKLSASPRQGGHQVNFAGKSDLKSDFEVCNDLPMGALDVCVYKAGRMLSLKKSVAPGQKAVFRFLPTLWIGVAAQVEQEKEIPSAIISTVNTEISLCGVSGADIVMKGGGDHPYSFTLENIKPA